MKGQQENPMQNNEATDSIAPVVHSAYAHVEKIVSQADGHAGTSPWWHGWAIREAFEAGAEWQRSTAASSATMAFEVIRHLTRTAEASASNMQQHGCDADLLKLAKRCSDCAEHIAQYFVEAPTEPWPLTSALRDLEWLIDNERGLMPDRDGAIALKDRIAHHLVSLSGVSAE